ncbi:MAG: hypothetical protein JWQ98_419 [Chlorobi bacterium]|nr:hypothetical protein [Chlorobiota bacterium]
MKFLNTMMMMAAISMITAGTAFSQTNALGVKKGSRATYEMSTKSDVVQTVQGQDLTVNSTGTATLELGVRNLAKDHIDWTFTLAKMRLVMGSPSAPSMKKDTTVRGKPMPFTTDLNGKVTAMFSPEADQTGKMMMGLRRTSVAEFFSPALTRTLKPGDSWEEKSTDTIENAQLQGAKIYVERTTKYTFDGDVDTLKAKTVRLRTEVTSMSISGAGSIQGLKLDIHGDGTSTATNYYTGDGLLLVSGSIGEMNMRVMTTGQVEMVIPITYKFSSSTVRKS